MKTDNVSTRFCEVCDDSVYWAHHQVNVNHGIRAGSDGLANQWPDSQVGDIMVVHHVKVDPVGSGCNHVAYLFAQTGKIGREDARSDDVVVVTHNGSVA